MPKPALSQLILVPILIMMDMLTALTTNYGKWHLEAKQDNKPPTDHLTQGVLLIITKATLARNSGRMLQMIQDCRILTILMSGILTMKINLILFLRARQIKQVL